MTICRHQGGPINYEDDDEDDFDDDDVVFSSSQRTSNTIGTRGGPINYDVDDDDVDDDDDDNDDDDDDVFDDNVLLKNLRCFIGSFPLIWGIKKVGLLVVKLVFNRSLTHTCFLQKHL